MTICDLPRSRATLDTRNVLLGSLGSSKQSSLSRKEQYRGTQPLLRQTRKVGQAFKRNASLSTDSVPVDFHGLKVQASRTSLPWPKVPLRRASVNSFGFGGSNAHVVLEEAKPWAKPNHVSSFKPMDEFDDFFAEDESVSDNLSILLYSANDEDSLLEYVEALRRHLAFPIVQVDLHDLAYTLAERRTHYLHRGFVVTDSAAFDPRALLIGKRSAESPRVGFVFTGQGAQWPRMGKLLVDRFPLANRLLRHLDSVLQQCRTPPP